MRFLLILLAALLLGGAMFLVRGQRRVERRASTSEPIPAPAGGADHTPSIDGIPQFVDEPRPASDTEEVALQGDLEPSDAPAAEPGGKEDPVPPSGVRVTGYIIDDATDNALSEALVSHPALSGGGERVAEDGFFSVEVLLAPGDPRELVVSAPNHLTLFMPLEADRKRPVRVQLPGGAGVAGIVRDGHGNPLESATVVVLHEAEAEPEELNLDRWPEGWRFGNRAARQTTETGPDGRFRMAGFLPRARSLRVRVGHDGWAESETRIEELGGLGQMFELQFTLRREEEGGVIAGTISLNGAREAGFVQWQGRTRSGAVRVVDGDFRIEDVEPGTVDLQVQPESLLFQTFPEFFEKRSAKVEAIGGVIARADFDFAVVLLPVEGRVVAESKKPIEGITVHVRRRETLGQESREKSNRRLEAKTDSQGKFAFQLPSIPEGYEIGAADGLRSQWISCFPPLREELELVLKDLVPLRLRVIDAQNGQPVLDGREVSLYFKPREEWRYQRVWVDREACDANGWREIELPVGEHDLLASLSRPDHLPAEVHSVVLTPQGPAPEVEVVIRRGYPLTLVLDPPEMALPKGCHVALIETELWDRVELVGHGAFARWRIEHGPPGYDPNKFDVAFDPYGRCQLTGLPAGRYRFKVIPQDIALTPVEIELPLPEPQEDPEEAEPSREQSGALSSVIVTWSRSAIDR